MAAPVADPLMARSSRGGSQPLSPGFQTDGHIVAFSCKDHGADAQENHTPTLRAMGHADSHANAGGQLAVAHTLKGGGFDASEDGTGRGTPIIPVDITNGIVGGDVSGTIERGQDKGNRGQGVIAFDTTQITSKTCRAKPIDGGPCHALSAHAHAHAPALAFHARQDPDSGEVTHPLDTDGFSIGIQTGWAVRRLTPRECERLMGYLDDFTLIAYRGKPVADGPRYRALGNSMCVNVMSWIGQRIALFERMRTAA